MDFPSHPQRWQHGDELAAAVRATPFGEALYQLFSVRRRERLLAAVCGRLRSVTVVMENLVDGHNVAAVLRTAEGLGLDWLHAVETLNKWDRSKAIARSAEDWIQVRKHSGVASCVEVLRDQGFVIAAADVGTGSVPLTAVPVDKPIAIVFGSEHAGLSQRALSLADIRFTVPMYGLVESFNVSVTAAMVLHDLTTRRRIAIGSAGDLDATAQLRRAHRDFRRALKNEDLYQRLRDDLHGHVEAPDERRT
jgi:tRNA (guanosine-2'-O-)-methyltransferase